MIKRLSCIELHFKLPRLAVPYVNIMIYIMTQKLTGVPAITRDREEMRCVSIREKCMCFVHIAHADAASLC